jgi:molecular chaperone GrpE
MEIQRSDRPNPERERHVPVRPATAANEQSESTDIEEELELWRDRALRLQAEMENYRKRQKRLADERITEVREGLLRRLLSVADELERIMTAQQADVDDLRQGVQLTRRTLMQNLIQEGVEPIESIGQPFDPQWHEAVGSTPKSKGGIQPGTVVQVLRPGYRIGDRLLRPARVIVSA